MSIDVVETSELQNIEAPATSLADTDKVHALLVNLETGKSLAPCQMAFPVLYYVIEGQGVLRVGEEQANLKTGSMAVVPAGLRRSLAAREHLRVLAVQLLS
jgi:quercetin dioxygenase-like cupin family protein